MRKSILSVSIAAALLAPAVASAQTPASSPLTGNVGFFSDYVFRGLTQTGGRPALQGGADYAHASGAYMGTWASNISWLNDAGAYTGSSLEWDFYGGQKGSIAGDLGYDVGLLYYWYPGSRAPGSTNASTLETYGAVAWKWLSAKLWYSPLNQTFGVPDSRGTLYLDLSANYPVTDKLNAVLHYGIRRFRGNQAAGSNDSLASYRDYKFGATYALPQSFTVGAVYTGTTGMGGTQKTFYTNAYGRFPGKSTITLLLQKTF